MPELSEGFKRLVLVLSVPGLYCLMVLAGRRLKRHHGVRLGWLYHLFALGIAVYFPAMLLDAQWAFLRHLGAVVVLLGSLFLIAVLDRYLWDMYFQQRHRVKVPKFLTQVVGLGIIMVAAFLVLDIGYGQTLKGLLIAPGIAAVVLGLAAQDLVGNIIAGIALQVGKPYLHGDWLFIDNRYAEVIEINWRSTRLRTNDDVCIEIPNRDIARQTIVNLNRPQRRHAMRLSLTLDYAAPPSRVKRVLKEAAMQAPGVASEPKPKVFLKSFAESGIEYEIKFWMDDFQFYNDLCDAIRTNAWYALRRNRIRIPYPTRTIQIEKAPPEKPSDIQTAARAILRHQPLFGCLTEEQLAALMPRASVARFGQGERLIEQGDAGDSMFLLVEGNARVAVERNGGSKPVASLKPGDCFGEMSLLTGERRSATVSADSDCVVVEIDKAVLGQSLKENPELLTQLSSLLARRQLETEGVLAAAAQDAEIKQRQTEYAETFADKLRRFFEL